MAESPNPTGNDSKPRGTRLAALAVAATSLFSNSGVAPSVKPETARYDAMQAAPGPKPDTMGQLAKAFDKTLKTEAAFYKHGWESLREEGRKRVASTPEPGIAGQVTHTADKVMDAGIEFVAKQIESFSSRKNGADQHSHMPNRTEVNPGTATPTKTPSQTQGLGGHQ